MLRKISISGKSYLLGLGSAGADGDVRFHVAAAEGDDAAGTAGERQASVIEVAPNVYSVLLEGRSFEARVIRDDPEVVVEINGERYPVQVDDPRRRSRGTARSAGEGRATVISPMPGKVVRVLALEGSEVKAGDGLLVIEAMKMQNEMKSPRDGVVKSIPVKEGETVAAGAVLAVVE